MSCDTGILMSMLNKACQYIKVVIKDFDIEKFQQTLNWMKGLSNFMDEHVPEWKSLVIKAGQKGLNWGLRCLEDMKYAIMEVLRENVDFLKATLKLGGKSYVRYSAQTLTKSGVRLGVKRTLSSGVRQTVSCGARQTVSFGVKQTASFGVKQALKGAAMPVGVAADIAQAGLEIAGYEEAGKKVGKVGNIAAGAMLGFTLGGPAGAGVGAAGGALLWVGGQIVGNVFERMIG